MVALSEKKKAKHPSTRIGREVTHDDYLRFLSHTDSVEIDGVDVKLNGPSVAKTFGPPENYSLESSTVWSFPDRGKWATHRGNYRGNWSPYVPHNLIRRYTSEGELVLDQMCGSGTTLVEARILGRPAIGVDVNPDAIMVTRDRLAFESTAMPDECLPVGDIKTFVADARDLKSIPDESVALVCSHPPYANIVSYTKRENPADLSSLGLNSYFEGMRQIARESYRVLQPGRHCAILIGDTRKHKHFVPLSARVLEAFLSVGFVLKEDVIKLQWNMKVTRERWRGKSYEFLPITHEHLFVFRKLGNDDSVKAFQHSSSW